MRSYTVSYLLNGRWERALFSSLRDAEEYAESIRRWPGAQYVIVKG